jgi:hypothetical protein
LTPLTVAHLGLPVAMHQRATAHHREVTRELVLVLSQPGTAPERLIEVAGELQVRFAPFTAQATAALESAIESGAERVDLRYDVTLETAQTAGRLRRLLDEVDRYCRSGAMLTLPAPEDIVAYRNWFLGEFVAQADGVPPTPWRA